MVNYIGVFDFINGGDLLGASVAVYLSQYGMIFWAALWGLLMVVIYIKTSDTTTVIVLTSLLLGVVATIGSIYDYFPVPVVLLGAVLLIFSSAAIFYNYYSKFR